MNGSNDTERWPHSLQITVFLNCPWKLCATTVLFLLRYFSQYLSASIASYSQGQISLGMEHENTDIHGCTFIMAVKVKIQFNLSKNIANNDQICTTITL